MAGTYSKVLPLVSLFAGGSGLETENPFNRCVQIGRDLINVDVAQDRPWKGNKLPFVLPNSSMIERGQAYAVAGFHNTLQKATATIQTDLSQKFWNLLAAKETPEEFTFVGQDSYLRIARESRNLNEAISSAWAFLDKVTDVEESDREKCEPMNAMNCEIPGAYGGWTEDPAGFAAEFAVTSPLASTTTRTGPGKYTIYLTDDAKDVSSPTLGFRLWRLMLQQAPKSLLRCTAELVITEEGRPTIESITIFGPSGEQVVVKPEDGDEHWQRATVTFLSLSIYALDLLHQAAHAAQPILQVAVQQSICSERPLFKAVAPHVVNSVVAQLEMLSLLISNHSHYGNSGLYDGLVYDPPSNGIAELRGTVDTIALFLMNATAEDFMTLTHPGAASTPKVADLALSEYEMWGGGAGLIYSEIERYMDAFVHDKKEVFHGGSVSYQERRTLEKSLRRLGVTSWDLQKRGELEAFLSRIVAIPAVVHNSAGYPHRIQASGAAQSVSSRFWPCFAAGGDCSALPANVTAVYPPVENPFSRARLVGAYVLTHSVTEFGGPSLADKKTYHLDPNQEEDRRLLEHVLNFQAGLLVQQRAIEGFFANANYSYTGPAWYYTPETAAKGWWHLIPAMYE